MNEDDLNWVTPALKNRGQVNASTGDPVDAKGSPSVSAKSVQFCTAPLLTAGCASGASHCPRQSLAILIGVTIAGFLPDVGVYRNIVPEADFYSAWQSVCRSACHGCQKSASLHAFCIRTGTFPPGDRKPHLIPSELVWIGLYSKWSTFQFKIIVIFWNT